MFNLLKDCIFVRGNDCFSLWVNSNGNEVEFWKLKILFVLGWFKLMV